MIRFVLGWLEYLLVETAFGIQGSGSTFWSEPLEVFWEEGNWADKLAACLYDWGCSVGALAER
jgi:hypothetical protein